MENRRCARTRCVNVTSVEPAAPAIRDLHGEPGVPPTQKPADQRPPEQVDAKRIHSRNTICSRITSRNGTKKMKLNQRLSNFRCMKYKMTNIALAKDMVSGG